MKCPTCGGMGVVVKCTTCGDIGCNTIGCSKLVGGAGKSIGQVCKKCKKGKYKKL
jgi:hypothetical protein